LYSSVLSQAGIAASIDFRMGFIAQNVTATSAQCHFDDGWGPSATDPKGIEGLQDCSLDRFNLCALAGMSPAAQSAGFDYLACTYRNQKETDTITDDGVKFQATVEYCAGVSGIDWAQLRTCAEGPQGLALAEASHELEQKENPSRDAKGHGHPTYVSLDRNLLILHATHTTLPLPLPTVQVGHR
jgi:hypothetical protein